MITFWIFLFHQKPDIFFLGTCSKNQFHFFLSLWLGLDNSLPSPPPLFQSYCVGAKDPAL